MAYCDRCNRDFVNDRALTQHVLTSRNHVICGSCNLDFDTIEDREEHYVESYLHHYCSGCDAHFSDEGDLQDHYEDDHHYCRRCREFFDYHAQLQTHFTYNHDYCESCNRFFDCAANLNAHYQSSVHQDRTQYCHHPGCNKAFLNDGDLVAHWEAGVCSSGVNRFRVDEAFVAIDSHDFTNPDLLDIDHDGYYAAPLPIDADVAQNMWNGDAWQCPYCRRDFGTMHSLRAHLESPAHVPRFYRCRGDFSGGCGAHFSTLSALVRHVESQRCDIGNEGIRNRLDQLERDLFF